MSYRTQKQRQQKKQKQQQKQQKQQRKTQKKQQKQQKQQQQQKRQQQQKKQQQKRQQQQKQQRKTQKKQKQQQRRSRKQQQKKQRGGDGEVTIDNTVFTPLENATNDNASNELSDTNKSNMVTLFVKAKQDGSGLNDGGKTQLKTLLKEDINKFLTGEDIKIIFDTEKTPSILNILTEDELNEAQGDALTEAENQELGGRNQELGGRNQATPQSYSVEKAKTERGIDCLIVSQKANPNNNP